MIPDYDSAARSATKALLEYGVTTLPVYPEQIIPRFPRTALISYRQWAGILGKTRDEVVNDLHFAKDCITEVINQPGGASFWMICYNQQKPFDRIRGSLSCELGHRCMEHIGFRDHPTRRDEACHFGLHFMAPRPFLVELQSRGIPLSRENIGNLCKCTDEFMNRLENAHPSKVDEVLNQELRHRFTSYVDRILKTGMVEMNPGTPLKLDSYMEGYEE